MVAYEMESDLVELIRPRYSRVEDEGRTVHSDGAAGYSNTASPAPNPPQPPAATFKCAPPKRQLEFVMCGLSVIHSP